MSKYGVFIGRFQPFHKGHEAVVNRILSDGLIPFIIIGSACQSNTQKNPKSYSVREQVIKSKFPTAIVRGVEDYLHDFEWVKAVTTLLYNKPCTIYYKRKPEDCTFGDSQHYVEHLLGRYDTQLIDSACEVSGTALREAINGVSLDALVTYQTNGFLSIKNSNGYYFVERKGKDSVAFILRDTQRLYDIYCMINEYKPPVDDYVVTAFGGSIDSDSSISEIVAQEVKEESGYDPLRITYIGKRFVSTQMNQYCHLFVVDVDSLKPGPRSPQCLWESKSKPIWVDEDFIRGCNDWKAQSILLSLRY